MKRRSFIKSGALLGAPLFLNGFPLLAKELEENDPLQMLAKASVHCGKVLVIIQQNGGNDGLNTVVPVDQYSHLMAARSNIIIPQNKLLPLTGNNTTGLHPALSGIQQLYNDGEVTIVQAVSYPNPNFSHFRATDIWFSGSGANTVLDTGWLGRSLDTAYANYPANYPNSNMPDPLAVQIGSLLPFSLQGPSVNMGYNVANPNSLLNVLNQTTDPAPNNDYGYELSFLRLMKDQSNAYTQRIQNAYAAQATLSTLYPATGNSLANQLKIVARLIGGGLKTPIYIVNHPNSHDTHSNQVDSTDVTLGNHANMLSILSVAVKAFMDDIEKMGKADDVAGMTFSEFGRRIVSNASMGTDHGSAAPVFFFGKKVNGGIIGTSPQLPSTPTVSNQVPMQYDFRQLYASVIEQWFCMSPGDAQTVLGNSFNTLPIFQTGTTSIKEYINLVGQCIEGRVQLSWDVAPDERYKEYKVEQASGSGHFETAAIIPSKAQVSYAQYQFAHNNRAPKMRYRIAAVTHDDQVVYSNLLNLRSDTDIQLVSVYPNPVKNHELNIRFFESVSGPVDITIYDLMGAKMYYDKRHLQGSDVIKVKLPAAFASYMHYVLELQFEGEIVREQLIFE